MSVWTCARYGNTLTYMEYGIYHADFDFDHKRSVLVTSSVWQAYAETCLSHCKLSVCLVLHAVWENLSRAA